MKIPLARPDITKADAQAVLDVLGTNHLALGPKLDAFEERIAEYAGVNYAVATNSGTSALHLIVRSMEIGEADEVITASFCCLLLSCVL